MERSRHEASEEDRRTREEAGTVLVMAMFLFVFVLGIVMSGSSMLESSKVRTRTSFMLTGQAAEFARSGMTEAINWFRRQDAQPVLAFEPKYDAMANPPVLDTDDPDIGLVREFRINGAIWGRYEVWKKWDLDPDPDRLAWRQQMQLEDVSLQRGRTTQGTVWRLRCVGYVFERRDANVGFRDKPNRVIATEVLVGEMSRLDLALPGQAAICARTGGTVTVATNGRVAGGDAAAGIYYASGTGTPITVLGQVTGVPAVASASVYNDSIAYVFGVNVETLRTMADSYITDPADFPEVVRDGSLVVLEGDSLTMDFTPMWPLRGSGVVVVRGNVNLQPGSTSYFNGLLYVDGNLTINAPAQVRGAAIVTGAVAVQGVGDYADVVYDDVVIDGLRRSLANYRISRAARRRVLRE